MRYSEDVSLEDESSNSEADDMLPQTLSRARRSRCHGRHLHVLLLYICNLVSLVVIIVFLAIKTNTVSGPSL